MSTDTIPSRTNGQTIDQVWFNILQAVIGTDFVPRTAGGIVTDIAGSLGQSSFRWLNVYVQALVIGLLTKQVTINAASAAAPYAVHLFTGLPASNLPVSIDASGNLTAVAITGGQIAAATITGSNVQNNISLTGKAVQENGLNVVVSSVNAGNSMAIIRGGVASGGTITIGSGEGFTVAHPSGGVYDITFSPAFLDTPTVVASINGALGTVSTSMLTNAGVRITTTDNGFTVVDEAFTFIALGQRP